MKNKTFKIILILSALPYLTLFIAPVFAAVRVADEYGFFNPYLMYLFAVLCLLGAVFPVIPLSVGFHAGIVINLMLKKLNISEKIVKILSVVSAIIIFIVLTVLLIICFSQMDSL